MAMEVDYRVHDGPPEEMLALSEGLCRQLFPTLSPGFVRSRLPFVADPSFASR